MSIPVDQQSPLDEIDYEITITQSREKPTKTPTKFLTMKVRIYNILRSCVEHPDSDHTYFLLPQEATLLHAGKLHIGNGILLSDDIAKQRMPEILSWQHVPEACHEKIVRKLCQVARSIRKSKLEGDANSIVMTMKLCVVKTKVYQYQEYLDMIGAAQQPKPIPATQAAIDALEKLVFDGDNNAGSMQACVICMEEIQAGLEVTRMPCKHIFHEDCIVPWLQTSHFCPLCRFALPHISKEQI